MFSICHTLILFEHWFSHTQQNSSQFYFQYELLVNIEDVCYHRFKRKISENREFHFGKYNKMCDGKIFYCEIDKIFF